MTDYHGRLVYLADERTGDMWRPATDDEIAAARASKSGSIAIDGHTYMLTVLDVASGNELAVEPTWGVDGP